MGHGTRSGDVFYLEGDSVRFKDSDPDRKYFFAVEVLKNHNGHLGNGVHDKTLYFHFNFHGSLLVYRLIKYKV